MTVTEKCKFCGRERQIVCKNTRDMDREDGYNYDRKCNDTLAKLGGGERGHGQR